MAGLGLVAPRQTAARAGDGQDVPERDPFWRTRAGRALHRGNLKYVRLGGTDRLYDLEADVREQANLAAKRPGDLATLRTAWETVDQTLLPCLTA